MNLHVDFIINKNTAVHVDITLQQQKDSVIVAMQYSEQRDDAIKEDKAEFGIKIDS